MHVTCIKIKQYFTDTSVTVLKSAWTYIVNTRIFLSANMKSQVNSKCILFYVNMQYHIVIEIQKGEECRKLNNLPIITFQVRTVILIIYIIVPLTQYCAGDKIEKN